MNHARLIFEDTPAFIPVPSELQHRKTEIIFLPLDDELIPDSTAAQRDQPLTRRPLGLAKDRGIPLPDDFFAPLPDDLLAAFNGER
jgi:hypothetical protein